MGKGEKENQTDISLERKLREIREPNYLDKAGLGLEYGGLRVEVPTAEEINTVAIKPKGKAVNFLE